MQRFHGKPIDVQRFKRPVLDDLRGHVRKVKEIAEHLAEHETPIAQSTCYICESAESVPFAEVFGFRYVRCSGCSHVFATQRYSGEALARLYREQAYYSEITYANKETCFYRRDQVAKPKFEFAQQFLADREGVWLDVGAGIGDLVSVARQEGWDARGLEISEVSVRFAREVFDIELENLPIETFCARNPGLAGQIEVVSLLGVLEHVVEPLEMLDLAWRLLRDDGCLLVQVPNVDSLSSMVQEVWPENVSRHLVPYSHIMLFSERSLLRALEASGFEPLAIWHLGLDVYELVNNLVLANKRVRDSRLYEALIGALNPLQQVIDERQQSDGLICIARKVAYEDRERHE
jgi:2-polyprenyl-3-methyl-5-hydroxy-6-metoxy-1,4-benzoquinol methylase